MITARRYRITTWLAVAIALVAPTGQLMPVLENTFSPIIVDSRVENVARADAEMCFDWRHKKRRAAPQLFFLFWASSPTHQDRTMLQARVVGHGEPRPLRTGLSRPAGRETALRLCFDLPRYIADDATATITGYVTYEGWIRTWWRMSYTIGSVLTVSPALETLEIPVVPGHVPPP